MTSAPVRDPLADHLITPENSALVLIDYQPAQIAAVRSMHPVVDAIGGTSPEAHRAGLDRVRQAGGQPISWVSLACELQRDWARADTVEAVIEIVLTDRLRKE